MSKQDWGLMWFCIGLVVGILFANTNANAYTTYEYQRYAKCREIQKRQILQNQRQKSYVSGYNRNRQVQRRPSNYGVIQCTPPRSVYKKPTQKRIGSAK